MRIILAILGSIAFLSPKAQTYLPGGPMGFQPGQPLSNYNQSVDSNSLGRKWQFTKFAGLSIGTAFYTGSHTFFPGGASFLSVPFGLQLSRSLSKNVYAFAGVSAAPTIFSFSHLYAEPMNSSFYPGSRPYTLGLNPRVEMGLMYVNDAKTFSISGSVGVERGSSPLYYPSRSVNPKQQ
jgi:hypothetical protein